MDQYSGIVDFANHMGPRSLPSLTEVEILSPCVMRVLGGNPGAMQLQGTNTYILGTGAERILIDSGEGRQRWAQLMAFLAKQHGFRISKVLLTHWHLDHTEGVRDLLHFMPELKNAVYKYDPDPSQQPITDGQVFAMQGITLHALLTPGHSTDHVCFLLEEENAIFTGDTVLGHGATAVEDLGQYMQSLERLQGMGCPIGYPGHGALISNLQHRIQQDLAQKRRREEQILLVLDKARGGRGCATQTELVKAVFGRVPVDVTEQFFEPHMKDILMKMAREKRVGFRFHGGQKNWFASSR